MDYFRVTYCLEAPQEKVEAVAEAVLLEQTTETPRSVGLRYPFVRHHMMGQIERLEPISNGHYELVLSLPVRGVENDPAQFLNVLFGNSSLHSHISLEDFDLPGAMAGFLPGPTFGINGIRDMVGVTGRPLTCSALKPIGLSTSEIAHLFRELAYAGIDIIKDDHYLADQSFAPFGERVRACLEVAEQVYANSGHRVLYVPNLSGSPDTIRRQAETAQALGVRAVMIAPMLTGLPTLHELCRTELTVPVIAHPSFSGSNNIRPSTLFGKLFRLFGADAVIFANYGGRFSYAADVCAEIATRLRADWMHVKPAFPVPAGGMDAARASELVHFFGVDSILLVGGSLLEAGEHLREKTKRFVEEVHAAAMMLQKNG